MKGEIELKSLKLLCSFIIGSLILSIFSTIQKLLVGFPLLPKSYIVPALFGGIVGVVINYLIICNCETKMKQQKEFQKEMVILIMELLEIHDEYTTGHSQNVANIAKKIAEEMGLSQEEIEDVYWAGLLHDIGKILIPKEILNKLTSLTDEEYEKIKKHPYWAYKALSNSKRLENIAEYVLCHHSQEDGNGYPDNIKCNKPPLVSKILCVADAWDAMRSNRSYRDKLEKEIAIKELEENKGTQFCPEVVEAFMKVLDKTDREAVC